MPYWRQFWFQDRASPVIEEFLIFHDIVFITIIFILILISLTFIAILGTTIVDHRLLQGNILEWVWTVLPGGFLFTIAIPSLGLLYIFDEYSSYAVRLKTVGHQWFWRYESMSVSGRDFVEISYDSYIIPQDQLNPRGFRLLDTDTHIVIPIIVPIQLIVTSRDVLHAWAIPCMGAKIDAIPGRLNIISLYTYNAGLFFGQCSEICGANHRFIPIVVEAIPGCDYVIWLLSHNSL